MIIFCNICFTRSLIYEENMIFFNAGLSFTPEVLILSKKSIEAKGAWVRGLDF